MASSATASQDPLPVPASRAVVVPAAEVPVVEPPSPCGVGVGALLQIRKAPVPGRPHPLADVLAVASKNGKTHKDKADSHAHRIAHTMLGSNVVHLSSNACFSEALKVSRHILLPRQKTVAAASFVASRQAKWNFEAALHSARGRVEGVAYVECARYDETPMRVRAGGQSSVSTVPLLALPASSSSSSLVPTSQAWAPSLGEQATTSSSAGKILQSELRYGILLKSGDCFFGIVGSQMCHLQLLERCTTKCMLSAQMALSAATPYCALFRHRLRLSTTDRHASNLACERVLSQNMGDSSFSLIHQTCDVHVVSRIHTRVFSMVQEHITGLLRHSLSLSVSANMNLFRRAIRLEIHRRGGVKLIQGQPPLSAQQYRANCLRLFASRGRNVIARRLLLMLLPNGNWQNSQVQMYVPSDCDLSQEKAVAMVSNGLVTALAGHMFELYPRHRWCGADLAVDRCGLLECVHGLGSGAYARYMELLNEQSAGDGVAADDGDPGALPLLPLLDGDPGRGDDQHREADGQAPSAEQEESQKGAAANAKHRRVASAWWRSQPLPYLFAMRIIMEPLRQMMSTHLDLGGDEWAHRQCRQAAAGDASENPHHRRFRACIAASLEVEKACLEQVGVLLSSARPWSLLPSSAHTVLHRCLVFRMLSRIGCCVEELLMKEHRGMPTRLFQLIDGDGATAEFATELRATTPDCLRDAWCRQFMNSYADMLSPDAKAVLTLQGSLLKYDIAQIECRHAALRRWLMARGLQTHVTDFQRLSGDWMAQQLRIHKAARAQGRRHAPARGDGKKKVARTKKKRGGGAGCRAFFSETLRHRKLRLMEDGVARELHKEYRDLSASEKRRLKVVGKKATSSWRGGATKEVSGFGTKRKRDVVRNVNIRNTKAWWRGLQDVAPDERIAIVVKQAFSTSSITEQFSTLMTRARSITRGDAQFTKEERDTSIALLNDWEDRVGNGHVEEFVNAVGATGEFAASLRLCLRAEPYHNLKMFKFEPPIAEPTADACAWAHGKHAADLRMALAEDWDRRHFTIMDADCPRLPTPAAGEEPGSSECLRRGVCVCSERGKKIAKAVGAMHRGLKAAYPRGQRAPLADGFVVCQLHKSAVGDAATIDVGSRAGLFEHSTVYFHVGLFYHSPFRPTFARMTYTGNEDENSGHGKDYVLLSAANEYFTEHEAFARLCYSDNWSMALYELESTVRPIPSMVPGTVSCRRIAAPDAQIWPPLRAERRGGDGVDGDDAMGGAPFIDDTDSEVEERPDADEDEDGDSDGGDGAPREALGLVEEFCALLDEGVDIGHEMLGAMDGAIVEAGPSAHDAPAEASSSADAPAVVLPAGAPVPGPEPIVAAPPEPPLGRALGPRGRAPVEVQVEGGTMYFYRHDGRFTAVCTNPFHGQCILTRHLGKRSHCKGRPVGLMAGWLAVGPLCETKADHWAYIQELSGEHEQRAACRARVMETPAGLALISCEADNAAGTALEPLVL